MLLLENSAEKYAHFEKTYGAKRTNDVKKTHAAEPASPQNTPITFRKQSIIIYEVRTKSLVSNKMVILNFWLVKTSIGPKT